MAYTIEQIDVAILAILPERVKTIERSRPRAMLDAAASAWVSERQEDEHSSILREAIRDLNKRGFLNPVGGFPEERS